MQQEGCARRVAWDLAKHIYKLKNSDKAAFSILVQARVVPAPTSKRPEEREFAVDSGVSMHMMSKKTQAHMNWTLCEDPENPTVVLTHTNEEAQVFVHDLNFFVTVQLLEDALAVLSLGKLCVDDGYSYEWVSGQKTTVAQRREDNCVQNGQFRTSCRSRVIHQFWKQFVVNIRNCNKISP